MNQQLILPYTSYMFALILSFFLGFYIIMKYYQGSFKQKIRYSITAGLLAAKFVIVIASLLGVDHVFLYIVMGKALTIPISSNGLLFTSSLFATLSLNWDTIQKRLSISEEEYQRLFEP